MTHRRWLFLLALVMVTWLSACTLFTLEIKPLPDATATIRLPQSAASVVPSPAVAPVATPDSHSLLRAVALRLDDLGPGFGIEKAGEFTDTVAITTSISSQPADAAATIATVEPPRRVIGYTEAFWSSSSGLFIDATLKLSTSPETARDLMALLKPRVTSTDHWVTTSADIGDECVVLVSDVTDVVTNGGRPAAVVIFRRHSFTMRIIVVGPVRQTAQELAMKYADVVDRRILALGQQRPDDVVRPIATETVLLREAPPYATIHEQHKKLTMLQWEEYMQGLSGTRAIGWTGRVLNVSREDTGYQVAIHMDPELPASIEEIYLHTELDAARRIMKGDTLEFSGTIDKAGGTSAQMFIYMRDGIF
jgi:hypothetical protein